MSNDNELMMGNMQQGEIKMWLQDYIEELQTALAEVCEQEHSYHYSPPGYKVDETAHDLKAFERLSDKFEMSVVQMTGSFDSFVGWVNMNINTLKDEKKGEIDLRRRAAEDTLTLASKAFMDGIAFIRESVEDKADNDCENMQNSSTEAREIIEYELELNKNELWRSISYLAKKLYADNRDDYNNKIKEQILEKFKEFRDNVVAAADKLQDTQMEKWGNLEDAMDDYSKFYETKLVHAKENLFDIAQHLLLKKIKKTLGDENESTGGKLDDYEMKVFKQLHQHRDIMMNLYNSAIKSIDKIDDRYLTTPLVEILNGHKEEADYQFDVREDEFLDSFVVVREWWVNFLEDQLDDFEAHIVVQAQICFDSMENEMEEMKQKTKKMMDDMKDFYDDEGEKFQTFVKECVDRFKWLLKKYGMGASLPEEDVLLRISPDPFTGALNAADAAAHAAQHANHELHSHGDGIVDEAAYPAQDDPFDPDVIGQKPQAPDGELPISDLASDLESGLSDLEDNDGHGPPAGGHHKDNGDASSADSDEDDGAASNGGNGGNNGNGDGENSGSQEDFGISEEDLAKKIESTVDFFLGKLPSRAQELIAALITRRAELGDIVAHIREGLQSALQTEFDQAIEMIRAFVSELEAKLAERDESALGTTREEVEKFIAEVNEVRENAWYEINQLKDQLVDADYDTAHKLQTLIAQQRAIFDASIESALVQMRSVVEQMQDAQDSAFEMAKNALSTTLNNKRTAFHASLDRDEASFNDALNHNMNAFNESIAAQRAAFENSLAEKQAAFDAAKERKLKQIHFVQDSNYKFHLIKLLEAKSAAITQAIGTARQGFSDVLNEEAQRFSERREAERVLFDEARAAMREAFADEEVLIEQELNEELGRLNEAFDAALDE